MPDAAEAGDWLPAAPNRGHAYRDVIRPADLPPDGAPLTPAAFYAARYRHSDADLWRRRLEAGEVCCNGRCLLGPASGAVVLGVGDRLVWRRPPWWEAAVPAGWGVVFDDGDLRVLDKPSGLPVLPGGGYLEHTLLRLLERRHGADAAGVPRPVHRLGRFTSGLLVCARRPASRAWLSARLRDGTAGVGRSGAEDPALACRKVYRALTAPLPPGLQPGESLTIRVPIGRRPHPRLGSLWGVAEPGDPSALPAESRLTLLERRSEGCLVAVAIRSGRPHQIRIHTAAIGAPLLGDPLYRPGGAARAGALPGEGGYRLHAHRLSLTLPAGGPLELLAPPPAELALPGEEA